MPRLLWEKKNNEMNGGWLVTWLVSWMPQGLFGIADQATKWKIFSRFLLGNRALIVFILINETLYVIIISPKVDAGF